MILQLGADPGWWQGILPELQAFRAGGVYFAIAFGVGYLFGSVPTGMILARIFGLGDLRQIGSGNIGATNVLRTGNRKAAAATLWLDMAKGAVPVVIFSYWGVMPPQFAALGAVVGHLLPVWLWFRGGKGVATYLGAWLALAWPVGLLNLAVWLLAAFVSKRSSVGALAAALACPVWLILMEKLGLVLLALILSALIWIRHAANIGRLIRGEEPAIRLRKRG